FGGFWSGIVAGTTSLLVNLTRRKPAIRVAFNVFQTILAVAVASTVFTALAGEIPPRLITSYSRLPFNSVLWQLTAFLLAATTYFTVNALAVAVVVTLSAGKTMREVLNRKTYSFIGYDLLASLFALGVAWVYYSMDSESGVGRLVLLAVF